jgi:hypothetical protein
MGSNRMKRRGFGFATGALWAVGTVLAGGAVLAGAPAAQGQTSAVKAKPNPDSDAVQIAPAVRARVGTPGQEWWRAGFEPFTNVPRPPSADSLAGVPTDEPITRALDCCPLGGWVDSLGFNPIWQGNVISISQPILLKEIEIEASFSGPLEITFGIYREKVDAPVGDYTALRIKKRVVEGTGRAFYSSGPLAGGAGVLLMPREEAGAPVSTFFAVAAGWSNASIDFRLDDRDYSLGRLFCAGRVRGSWGLLSTNPPDAGGFGSDELLNLQFFDTGAVSMRMCFEVPGGACCRGDRTCVDDVTSNGCVEDLGGQFLGLFSLCALEGNQCTGFGACCPQGQGAECEITSNGECDGTYKGDGTACNAIDPCDPVLGACCSYDGSCDLLNEYDCEVDPTRGTPGMYLGDGVECQDAQGQDRCEALGACCDGLNCTDTTADQCELFDCVPQLGGNVCPTGYELDTGGECPVITTTPCVRPSGLTFSLGQPCIHDACSAPVGACCLFGACSVESRLNCENQGGTFLEVGSNGVGTNGLDAWQACEIQPPGTCALAVDEGACCLTNGGCDVLTEADCTLAGGDFQAVGSACTDFICSMGACCHTNILGDPDCVVTRPLVCADPSGLDGQYQGPDTTCPANCFPTGACCLPDGSCRQLTESDCANTNGVFQGEGTECQNVTCPVPGACCVDIGVAFCFEETDLECAARPTNQNAVFTAFATCENGCASGACCDLPGDCNITTGPECTLIAETLFTPGVLDCGGFDCPVRGACCTSNGCELATEDVCTSGVLNGVYRGDGVSCSTANVCDISACCEAGQPCVEKFITDCTGFAGDPGEACTPDTCTPGACCVDFNPFCLPGLLEFQCRAITLGMSQFGGPGTTCPDACAAITAACCKPDGSCELLTEAACNAITGASWFLGEDCGSVSCPVTDGACCEIDGTCSEISGNACAAIALATFTAGETCATAPACPDLCGASINSDFNGDGNVDLLDFAMFQMCFGQAPDVQCLCAFDDDGSGVVDDPDLVELVNRLGGPGALPVFCQPFLPITQGDYDDDGKFDLRDYQQFQACFVSPTNECKCVFDFDRNNAVDLGDLNAWAGLIAGPNPNP